MKIFLDVGANKGQTLISVFDPKYDFDKIFSFEPVKSLHEHLNKVIAGKKNITLLKFGLWNENTTKKIYSPGSLAGSLFSGHQDVDENNFELCEFVDASEWFNKNISHEDEVYVKMNCEGAEADILLNLLASKEIFKITNVMIDFDVRKVKGLEYMQQEVLNRFKDSGFKSYSLWNEVMLGPTYIPRTQNWLDTVGANKTDVKSQIKQSFYWWTSVILNKRPGFLWELKHTIKSHTPLFLLKVVNARRN